jgi:hypothetical protein
MKKNVLSWGYSVTLTLCLLLFVLQFLNAYFGYEYQNIITSLILLDAIAMLWFVRQDISKNYKKI